MAAPGILDSAKLSLAARYYGELDPAFRDWWQSQQGQKGRYEALVASFRKRGYGATAAQILDRVTLEVRRAQKQRAQPRLGTSAAQFAPDRQPRPRRT